MTTVRPLEPADVELVVARIVERLALDAHLQPLVNPVLSTQLLSDSLHQATDESALHFRQNRPNVFLLCVHVEKLSLHRLVEFVEVRSTDRVPH